MYSAIICPSNKFVENSRHLFQAVGRTKDPIMASIQDLVRLQSLPQRHIITFSFRGVPTFWHLLTHCSKAARTTHYGLMCNKILQLPFSERQRSTIASWETSSTIFYLYHHLFNQVSKPYSILLSRHRFSPQANGSHIFRHIIKDTHTLQPQRPQQQSVMSHKTDHRRHKSDSGS